MRWLLLSSLLAASAAVAADTPSKTPAAAKPGAAPQGQAAALTPAQQEVMAAERAFAQAFADRDEKAFFAFLLEDAIFQGRRVLSGKGEVRAVWSRFFAEPQPPFRWEPDRAVVNAAGDLAQTSGPVHDKDGKLLSRFVTVWRKQADGAWKVAFDGPGIPGPCVVPPAP